MLQTIFKYFLPASHEIASPTVKGDGNNDESTVKEIEIIDEGGVDTKVVKEGCVRSERDDENEAAILPTDIPTTISALVGDSASNQDCATSVTPVSSTALPSLTLSVVQSNLKLTAAASAAQTSFEKDQKKDQMKDIVGSSTISEKDTEQHSSKKVAPLLPAFAHTLDPKFMPGYSSPGLFGGKSKEKNWKLPLFGSRRKVAKKDCQSQPPTTKEMQENPTDKKQKNTEGTL